MNINCPKCNQLIKVKMIGVKAFPNIPCPFCKESIFSPVRKPIIIGASIFNITSIWVYVAILFHLGKTDASKGAIVFSLVLAIGIYIAASIVFQNFYGRLVLKLYQRMQEKKVR